jgi:hypothetical protein
MCNQPCGAERFTAPETSTLDPEEDTGQPRCLRRDVPGHAGVLVG